MFGSKLEIKRFEKTVLKYEAEPIQKGKILLYGHSLFTRCSIPSVNRWGNPVIDEAIIGRDGTPAVLNHGFGTSSADDLLYYYPRLVRPYEPRAMVISTANNDFGFGYNPEQIMEITARIIDYAQADFPDLPVYLCTTFPGLKHKGTVTYFTRSRNHYDELVEAYCARRKNVTCLRLIEMPFLFENPEDIGDYEKIREDIYAEDRTHFDAAGYSMFIDYMREALKEVL